MKVTIKIDGETLFLLNACLGLYRKNDLSHCKDRNDKSYMAIFFEVRDFLAKKAIGNHEEKKVTKVSFPFYYANTLLDFVENQLQINVALGVFEKNKLELLKNQLHQKLL